MNRPGKKITRKGIKLSNKMREMERQNKSSKSLIANVVDMNDDYRFLNPVTSIGSVHTRYGLTNILFFFLYNHLCIKKEIMFYFIFNIYLREILSILIFNVINT